MAGDFNCVQTDNDCTGHRYSSRSLDRLLHGLRLTDVWDASLNTYAYTHYTPTGASRLDRIYVADEIRKPKQGVETLAAAFTNHMAVLLRVHLSIPFTLRGKGRWCLNTSFLDDLTLRDKLKAAWPEWKKHIPHLPSTVHWWELYVKHMVKILFTRENTERNSDRIRLENFLLRSYLRRNSRTHPVHTENVYTEEVESKNSTSKQHFPSKVNGRYSRAGQNVR